MRPWWIADVSRRAMPKPNVSHQWLRRSMPPQSTILEWYEAAIPSLLCVDRNEVRLKQPLSYRESYAASLKDVTRTTPHNYELSGRYWTISFFTSTATPACFCSDGLWDDGAHFTRHGRHGEWYIDGSDLFITGMPSRPHKITRMPNRSWQIKNQIVEVTQQQKTSNDMLPFIPGCLVVGDLETESGETHPCPNTGGLYAVVKHAPLARDNFYRYIVSQCHGPDTASSLYIIRDRLQHPIKDDGEVQWQFARADNIVWPVGTRVGLHGLRNARHLNGREGRIYSFSKRSNRHIIRLRVAPGCAAKTVCAKPRNIHALF